jgi:molecular chaperone DnaK
MRVDAEKFAEEDQKRREIAEVRNAAENALYVADKVQNQEGTRPVAEIMVEIDEKKRALRDIADSEDMEAIKQATRELLTTLDNAGIQSTTTEDEVGPGTETS